MVVVIVALYFWSPLVLKWTRGKASSRPSQPARRSSRTIRVVMRQRPPHPATDVAHWEPRADRHCRRSVHGRGGGSRCQLAAVRLPACGQSKATRSLTAPPGPANPAVPNTLPVRSATAQDNTQRWRGCGLNGVILSSVLIGKRDRAAMIGGESIAWVTCLNCRTESWPPAVELVMLRHRCGQGVESGIRQRDHACGSNARSPNCRPAIICASLVRWLLDSGNEVRDDHAQRLYAS